MCDISALIGLASGGLQAIGQNETAKKNNKMVRDQQIAEMAMKQRELIIEKNAANKEGYEATLEKDRNVGLVKAQGEGARGLTIGLRKAEQDAQGARSVHNAKDRATNAEFNYEQGVTIDAQEAANKIAVNTPSKGATFANIITSGIQGYGSFA